jgi:hypothetical protein
MRSSDADHNGSARAPDALEEHLHLDTQGVLPLGEGPSGGGGEAVGEELAQAREFLGGPAVPDVSSMGQNHSRSCMLTHGLGREGGVRFV